ncbi:hypothetical protein [Streptomyces longwoodensis]|uniref:hypothetical protein n=1 Tax=Streptomyces longwoodensis TaxID=68231 RepID=UPI0033C25116
MNQRKDNYRAALRREPVEPQPPAPRVTTLSNRYVRVTIELDADVQRRLDRWVTPAAALVTGTARTALGVVTALADRVPPSGTGSRT